MPLLFASPLRPRAERSGVTLGARALGRHGHRLGIVSVRDLLTTFPKRYRDLRELTPLAALHDLEAGQDVTVEAEVVSIRIVPTMRRRVQRTIAVLRQGHHTVEVIWFGRRFIELVADMNERAWEALHHA